MQELLVLIDAYDGLNGLRGISILCEAHILAGPVAQCRSASRIDPFYTLAGRGHSRR